MRALILSLLCLGWICAVAASHPPGYYFVSSDEADVKQPALFYVQGAPSYETPAVGCNPTSTLRDSVARVYKACGAVTVDPKTYFQQWSYQPLVVGNVGPRIGSLLTTKLILYSVTGSKLELCATEHGAYRLSECLTPEQQRMTQCLHDNLPPTVNRDCMPIWGLVFLCALGLIIIVPAMLLLAMLGFYGVQFCFRKHGKSKPIETL